MATLGFAFPLLAEENSSLSEEANAGSSLVVAESNGSLDDLASETNASEQADYGEGKAKAYVIPVRDQIGGPILDILRRGLKDAIRAKANTVILDMNTPGGELGVTLEIMQEIIESFERFDGPIITYVNTEAISAGAYIAVATNEIAFAPYGQIGAAEAVSGGGGNIDSAMKRKVNSYLKAKIRSFAGKHRYRARVMAAMMDANETLFVEGEQPLTADGFPIQGDEELLTLTAEEAVVEYGEPPQPLLGTGIYKTIEDLLAEKYGEGNYEVVRMEVNWAERLGLWLNSVGPIIMGLGMLLLFIEFKTPGFGVFGASGLVLLMIFFGSKYVAGFAGYEEVIVFLLGACLVALEVFLFPGLVVPAYTPPDGVSKSEALPVFSENMEIASEALAALGIPVLIEALNPDIRPNSLLTTTNEVKAFIDEIGHPNLGIEYDAYHCYVTEGCTSAGDMAATIETHLDLIGNIQIADVPGRNEPGTGTIDHDALFGALDKMGYDKWVAAEYEPSGGTLETLGWRDGWLPGS